MLLPCCSLVERLSFTLLKQLIYFGSLEGNDYGSNGLVNGEDRTGGQYHNTK